MQADILDPADAEHLVLHKEKPMPLLLMRLANCLTTDLYKSYKIKGQSDPLRGRRGWW